MLGILTQGVFAQSRIPFGPKNSKINSSIKYSVVGQYRANFDRYQGILLFDEKDNSLKEVSLEIESGSIHSKFLTLDNIVRSKQILNIAKFPRITFQSQSITKNEKSYQVKGVLDLHGVKKEFVSTFTLDKFKDEQIGTATLILKGKWVLKRKEYGIIWSKLFDHGGVLIGDHLTVEWEIKSPLTIL